MMQFTEPLRFGADGDPPDSADRAFIQHAPVVT